MCIFYTAALSAGVVLACLIAIDFYFEKKREWGENR